MKTSESRKILVLAGTGEGIHIIENIQPLVVNHQVGILVSVVGDNAAREYQKRNIAVRIGAMNNTQMADIVRDESIITIIDATHPFAAEASKNAMIAANSENIGYIRYERGEIKLPVGDTGIFYVKNHEEAADLAISWNRENNRDLLVMLATGGKSLELYSQKFSGSAGIEIVARLLPSVENLELCKRCNIPAKNIVAIQGPFSRELNREIFLKYKINVLISKESGQEGSTEEKVLAARDLGIKTIIINRPELIYNNLCRNLDEVKQKLAEFI